MDLSAHFDSCIQPPERLTRIESWHRHMPFACAILRMLQPDTLVELGTHRGDSYSAFCQAVVQQKLPTRCFAVDTWQGDAHAGEYGDDIYQELCQWHAPRYGAFSSLLRMTFDQAREHFADGSVDLLHIDGLHTYEAVKHDFDSWRSKLSDRAVVLFHDTNVHYGDFAVWKLWAELEQQFPAFEFPFGFGLGVLAVGANVPPAVLEFLEYAKAQPEVVVDYFHRHGDAAEVRKKHAEIDRLQGRLQEVGSQLEHARAVVERRDQALQHVQQQLSQVGDDWERERLQAAAWADSLQAGLDHAREQLFACQQENIHLLRVQANHRRLLGGQEYQLRLVLESRLWRMRNRAMRVLGLGRRQVKFAPLELPPMLSDQVSRLAAARPAVTIIVPVYRGLDDTRACIEAILASSYRLQAELVVINDASPEPELTQWLEDNRDRFTLLRNERNLGFVGTVNRGMRLYPDQDVVLVNSDAEVANDWLDRLQKAAYTAPDVGSVTPFSNNATICSFPRFCQDNALPEGMDVARLDTLFAEANAGQSVDIPTAVGFCMYIRRDCLLDTGLFDQDRFGRGYGEENEFCMRSNVRGWRHLLAGDVFVYHKGGVSFAETQSENQKHGRAALLDLFPDYDWVIQQHIAADPAARLRFAAEMALVRDSGLPVILMINHSRGGGSQRHMRELAATVHAQAHVYALHAEGTLLKLQSMADDAQRAALYFDPAADAELLLGTLRQLGVCHVHYHHLIDLPEIALQLPEALSCHYDLTIHDFYLACPQVTLADAAGKYCGAPDLLGCNSCLEQRPVTGVSDIEHWRQQHWALLAGADRVFVPSLDTLQRIRGYFPVVQRWVYAPHTTGQLPALRLPSLSAAEPLRVLVLGALSRFKGADMLEAAALQARAADLPLEFHLLGYGYRNLRTRPVSALQVHGAYMDAQVQERIAELQPHLIWFPGNCPETWSYTLSTALEAGLPVLATDIGAFSERLSGREWSWLLPANSTVQEWLEQLNAVRVALITQQPPLPRLADGHAIDGFDYAEDYVVGMTAPLPAEPVEQRVEQPLDANSIKQADAVARGWLELHQGWQHAGRSPALELLPQVRNPRVRKILVYALRRGWLQPVLARVPVGLQDRLKRLLVRG